MFRQVQEFDWQLRENSDLELVLISRLRQHGSVLFATLKSKHKVRWFGWEYPRALTPFNVIPYWVWEFAFFLKLRRIAKKASIILVVHCVSLDALVAVLFRRIYHCRLAAYATGSDINAPRSTLHGRFLEWTLQRVDTVFCVNAEMKSNLARLGRDDGIVLPTPFMGGPASVGELPKAFDVVNVGNLIPIKEQDILIKSLKYVGRSIKTAIVGDGCLMAYLQDLSLKQEGCEVQFFGQVPHQRIWEILGESKVYAHTCRVEGMPAAVLEAVSCGLPVVAAEGPYLRDMREAYGFRIRVVPAGSPQLLGSAITDVLEHYPSYRAEALANKERLASYQEHWQFQFDCALNEMIHSAWAAKLQATLPSKTN